MSYLGGKAKNAAHILEVLNHPAFDGLVYVEPFVGYGHVLRRVVRKARYVVSDANRLVVALLRAVQAGDELPRVRDATEYAALRRAHRAAPEQDGEALLLTAVAAFTYSFNGKEFGGWVDKYVRRDGRVDDIPQSRFNYYAQLRANATFGAAELACRDYAACAPVGSLVYCDPPYADTTPYGSAPFCSAQFWDTVRRWSARNIVLVSEYAAPDDFVCVAAAGKRSCVAGGHAQSARVERLFVHRDALAAQDGRPVPLCDEMFPARPTGTQ